MNREKIRKGFVIGILGCLLLLSLTGGVNADSGENLATNPSFENGAGTVPDFYEVEIWWPREPGVGPWKTEQVFQWVNDSKMSHSGNGCIRLIDLGFPPVVKIHTQTKIPVDTNFCYEVSVYAKGGQGNLRLNCYDAAGNGISPVDSPTVELSSTWTKISFQFVGGDLPKGTCSVDLVLCLRPNYGDVYFDDISFVKTTAKAVEASKEESFKFGNKELEFSFKGLSLEKISHQRIGYLQKETSLFNLSIGGRDIFSNDFHILKREIKKDKLTVLAEYPSISVQVKFELELENSKSYWSLSVKNNSGRDLTFDLHFPFIKNVRIGESWKDNIAMIPFRLGIISRASLLSDKRQLPLYNSPEPYLGSMSMQVLDLSDSSLKKGVCLIVEDENLLDKSFGIFPQDKDEAVTFLASYRGLKLSPGESFTSPRNLFYFHPGGWEEACDTYRSWFYSKFGRLPPRPKWVAEAIGDARIHWVEKAAEIVKTIPFYKNTLFRINVFWASFTIPATKTEAVRKTIEELHRLGTNAIVYFEGWVLSPETEIWKKHGKEWVMRDRNGNIPITPYGNVNPMCPGATGWQDFLANDAVDIALRLGFDGILLDSLGKQAGHMCYNLNHGHKSPRMWNEGCFELFQKVGKRLETLNPDAALRPEGIGSDFLALVSDYGDADQFAPYYLFKNPATLLGHNGTFEVVERITNVLKYTFPEIVTITSSAGTGDIGDPHDCEFAEVLLCNEIAHINGQVFEENINTPTITKLIKIRLENLDTLNYGLLDKYLQVSASQKLIYNGFKGTERYLVALINPSSSPCSYEIKVPFEALPVTLPLDRMKIEDKWGSKIQWREEDKNIIIKGVIDPYPWDKLRKEIGVEPFRLRVDRFKDLRSKYEKVESLEPLDNVRIIVISSAL